MPQIQPGDIKCTYKLDRDLVYLFNMWGSMRLLLRVTLQSAVPGGTLTKQALEVLAEVFMPPQRECKTFISEWKLCP